MTVMTEYNSKSYQIDGIDFKKNPENVIFEWDEFDKLTKRTDRKKSNMIEYF
jgi:hypothetical protein